MRDFGAPAPSCVDESKVAGREAVERGVLGMEDGRGYVAAVMAGVNTVGADADATNGKAVPRGTEIWPDCCGGVVLAWAGGGLLLARRLGGDVGGVVKFNVKGENPGRVDDDGTGRRSSGFGLEGLGKIGIAGTGGILSPSSSSLPCADFLGRLRKKAIARDLTLPGDFPRDLLEDADR